jgi:Protein of unknown function (DUF2568)
MFAAVNLLLRFLLELAALAALGWYGARTGDSTLAKVALGAGLPLATAVVWGLFVAPKATFDVPVAVWVALQALVFGGAALALLAIDRDGLAATFAALVVFNCAALLAARRPAWPPAGRTTPRR